MLCGGGGMERFIIWLITTNGFFTRIRKIETAGTRANHCLLRIMTIIIEAFPIMIN
ncbi:hypothetical protein D3C76_1847790 [compost metagenome]